MTSCVTENRKNQQPPSEWPNAELCLVVFYSVPSHHLTLNALLVSHTRCILRLWHRWCPVPGHHLLSLFFLCLRLWRHLFSLSLLLQVFIHESYSQIPTNMPSNFLVKRGAELLLSLPFSAPGFISLYSSVADHVNISNLLVHPHLLRSSKVDGSSLVQTWNTSSFLKRLNKGFMIRYQLPNILLFTLEGVRCM